MCVCVCVCVCVYVCVCVCVCVCGGGESDVLLTYCGGSEISFTTVCACYFHSLLKPRLSAFPALFTPTPPISHPGSTHTPPSISVRVNPD